MVAIIETTCRVAGCSHPAKYEWSGRIRGERVTIGICGMHRNIARRGRQLLLHSSRQGASSDIYFEADADRLEVALRECGNARWALHHEERQLNETTLAIGNAVLDGESDEHVAELTEQGHALRQRVDELSLDYQAKIREHHNAETAYNEQRKKERVK